MPDHTAELGHVVVPGRTATVVAVDKDIAAVPDILTVLVAAAGTAAGSAAGYTAHYAWVVLGTVGLPARSHWADNRH